MGAPLGFAGSGGSNSMLVPLRVRGCRRQPGGRDQPSAGIELPGTSPWGAGGGSRRPRHLVPLGKGRRGRGACLPPPPRSAPGLSPQDRGVRVCCPWPGSAFRGASAGFHGVVWRCGSPWCGAVGNAGSWDAGVDSLCVHKDSCPLLLNQD